MNSLLGRLIYPFLFPGGALVVLLVWWQRHPEANGLMTPYVDILGLVFVAAGVFYGWRFNRTRLLYALLLLVAGERLLTIGDLGTDFVRLAVGVVLPLNLMLIAWFGERGLVTAKGLQRWGWFALQGAVLVWLYRERYDWTVDRLQQDLVQWAPLADCPLPQSALGAFLLALTVLGIRFLLRPTIFEGAFFWATAAVLVGLGRATVAAEATPGFVVAVLLLLIGAIETSYFQAFRDELTGLPGRRAFNDALLKLGSRYTIAMVDIDHFKKFNDTYGHDVGDQVLRLVARILQGVRGGGRAYRYGGEEFAVVFGGKAVTDAKPFLEVLREEIATSVFILRGPDRPEKKPDKPRPPKRQPEELRITVSIGVAERTRENPLPDDVVKAADEALYRAKKAGRNCLCD